MVCFNCKVSINGNILHEKTYDTLKEISKELNLSYQQVADYSANRVKRRNTNNFIYYPQVEITKIKKEKPQD